MALALIDKSIDAIVTSPWLWPWLERMIAACRSKAMEWLNSILRNEARNSLWPGTANPRLPIYMWASVR